MPLNLRHECGGVLEMSYSQGIYGDRTFKCEKCNGEETFHVTDEDIARMETESERERIEWAEKAKDWVVPQPDGRMLTMEEMVLLEEYRAWSENTYAAGFMDPSPSTVSQFIERIELTPRKAWKYEEEFLEEYKKQKGE